MKTILFILAMLTTSIDVPAANYYQNQNGTGYYNNNGRTTTVTPISSGYYINTNKSVQDNNYDYNRFNKSNNYYNSDNSYNGNNWLGPKWGN